MAVKKSELYSSLWKSCDELRGGMDASQYKDYILDILFIKYVSDKYSNDPDAMVTIPRGQNISESDLKFAKIENKDATLKEILKGGSFEDMVYLKNKAFIGDGINIIFGNFQTANPDLTKGITFADFNDENKLGVGSDMVKKLTKLISIFETTFDFSKNKIGGDDILGDAYEYLMRNFAQDSGKSKGQFYTPSEVSRILAKIIGVNASNAKGKAIYDPTCGSGSLLLKVSDESNHQVALYGQEMDNATYSLAKMNMILHGVNDFEIEHGNTLSNPKFLSKGGGLQLFDYIVANPPFSTKSWMASVNVDDDGFHRFVYGTPPEKNGDYAFLLHILASLKSTGKGAVILPHGVLFRGNAESEIRKNLIQRGYIKGIIGLPANLFFGTGIPACIILLDKENAADRDGIFMVDASKGFIKDGNKNRLREQDMHKIVDVFNHQIEVPAFARLVSLDEIATNDFNLNIPRYVDNQEVEDIQDIGGHLFGGIPARDLQALADYWDVYPSLKNHLFAPARTGYSELKIAQSEIKTAIFEHAEFVAYNQQLSTVLDAWILKHTPTLKNLTMGFKPKELIHQLSEDMLQTFSDKKLIDRYDVFQHLMNYWDDVMQDDAYLIASEGWIADKDLVPVPLVINRYFSTEKKVIEDLETKREDTARQMEELEEEHGVEDGVLEIFKSDKGVINKKEVEKRWKSLKKETDKPLFKSKVNPDLANEERILAKYCQLIEQETKLKTELKTKQTLLNMAVIAKYKVLTETEIKTLVVDDKLMTAIRQNIQGEMERISQRLTQGIRDLGERYGTPLPAITTRVNEFENKVMEHFKEMGFTI
jgi:type I restriction enzyme M protein